MTSTPVTNVETPATDASILGPWVELHEELCRGGVRRHQLLINHRDNVAVRLTESETELCRRLQHGLRAFDDPSTSDFVQELGSQGFLSDGQSSVAWGEHRQAPPRQSFASTLDVSWKGANRLVQFLHDHGARHLFHPVAAVAQVVLALAGLVAVIIAACSHQVLDLRVHPAQIPWIIAMSLVAIAIHELAHALVVVHNGRSVDAVGMRFFLGTPSFYVESIDALLLPRRQRLIQAAAGPWAEWLVVSVVALWLWQSPMVLAIPLIHRFVLLNAATIGSNLLPFAGLDGSWILADAIGEPDLAQRSRGAVSRLLGRTCTDTPNSTEDWALAGYSSLNTFVAGLLIATSVFFWYQLFGNLMEGLFHRGLVGWLILLAAATVLGRPVINAILPRMLSAVESTRILVNQVNFRLQWTWRIASIQQLAASFEKLARLSDPELSVLAGHLRRIRIFRNTCPPADGYVIVHSGRVTLKADSSNVGTKLSAGATFRPEQRIARCAPATVLVVLMGVDHLAS